MELGIPLDLNPEQNVKCDFIVIGGGVAGLSCTIRLAELGADVVLLEGGNYPAQKICGEFLSPEAIPILENWGIPTSSSVSHIEIVMAKKHLCLKLPEMAATAKRWDLDTALAKKATEKGARIVVGAKVVRVEPSVVLSTGEEWEAPCLLIATGRLSQLTPNFRYVGFKAHFQGIDLGQTLQMHLMNGAYVGMGPIGKNCINVAGLVACTPEEAIRPKETLSAFFKRNELNLFAKLLSTGHCLFDDWMAAPVPEFGIRTNPFLPNVYYLGDAAGVIPPATGNGLSMALTSGILAAEYAFKGHFEAYRTAWNKTYKKRIQRGFLLHRCFLNPLAQKTVSLAADLFPSLPYYLYRSTR